MKLGPIFVRFEDLIQESVANKMKANEVFLLLREFELYWATMIFYFIFVSTLQETMLNFFYNTNLMSHTCELGRLF